MRGLRAMGSLVGIAGLLLPGFAAADSAVAVASIGKGTVAVAHVRFQVVIPLSLAVGASPGALSIDSSGRSVAVGAWSGTAGHDLSFRVLSAPAHKHLSITTVCAPIAGCTVSMP